MSQANHHDEEKLDKLYDSQAARRLLRYLRPYQRLVVSALALTIVLNLVRQIGPLLVKWALDGYIQPAGEGKLAALNAFDGIMWLSLAYLLTLAVTLGLSYFQDVALNTIGQRVMYDLRAEIFHKLQTIEVAYYDQTHGVLS